MEKKYYFISYECEQWSRTVGKEAHKSLIQGSCLVDEHPVQWVVETNYKYENEDSQPILAGNVREWGTYRLLFWQEIPENIYVQYEFEF